MTTYLISLFNSLISRLTFIFSKTRYNVANLFLSYPTLNFSSISLCLFARACSNFSPHIDESLCQLNLSCCNLSWWESSVWYGIFESLLCMPCNFDFNSNWTKWWDLFSASNFPLFEFSWFTLTHSASQRLRTPTNPLLIAVISPNTRFRVYACLLCIQSS